jgi:mannobiose 2-epimerase
MKSELLKLKSELTEELGSLLNYWSSETVDNEFGGFFGKIDEHNIVIREAEKGLVLNARILWTFSAAYKFSNESSHLKLAERAYNYLKKYFADNSNSGLYWSVAFDGTPLQTRKQFYGQAFVIYALAEYFSITQNSEVLKWAISLFETIEKYSFDTKNGGYIEALNQTWQPINDMKLSDKDFNEPKSMNTHLHILESYTNLFRVWQDEHLRQQLTNLIRLFLDKIIDQETGSQRLFFDNYWNSKATTVSFGHDIETSWLLLESVRVIGDAQLIEEVKSVTLLLAKATAVNLSGDGGLPYELAAEYFDHDRHWWVQAEAMVGFYNAFELSESPEYLDHALLVWNYIKKYVKSESGEWHWGVNADTNQPLIGQDKVGFWKCPYHNTRACLEIIRRINDKQQTYSRV